MSQTKHVYRNEKNGRLGELTEEVAAIWPDLLTLVEDTVDDGHGKHILEPEDDELDDAEHGDGPDIEEKD